ncbi:MAG: (Fe-S)-binding protein [Proteobacteria bacterium]|nr:(Fe-S)-binding protein [Pseudomonadota bacterium]MBU1583036.1 (Fe-S)-binding protein [Pseudomonadota bacterium]MBU2631819.1 (Fe-S)-binding protein [Pseudomonadota bacterium]
MQQLARDVKTLESLLSVCTRCGMCQANCPLFAQTRKEADVSRGKFALLNGLIEQMFEDAKGVNERLQRCLLCGSCGHGCPSNVSALEIFLKARTIITQYLGLPFSKKILFKKILCNPETFNGIMGTVALFQKILFKKEQNFQGTSCARIASPLLRHRHIVSLKETAFNRTLDGLDYRINGKGVKVAFFVGCLIDKAFPNIAHSVVTVLKHFNAQVFIPSHQGCCGIPAIASGDLETFEALVKLHVDLFSKEKFDYLVTACATCSSTIINLWPGLLKHMDKTLLSRIESLAQKTVDISWLMEKRFDIFSAISKHDAKKEMVTYHDPCHLKKSLGVFNEPRQVILASGRQLIEMADADICCGMGGSFNLMHYDLSSEIGLKKAGNIVKTGCSTVATSCPACMMQISDMLATLKHQVMVKHPVEIYAKALVS